MLGPSVCETPSKMSITRRLGGRGGRGYCWTTAGLLLGRLGDEVGACSQLVT